MFADPVSCYHNTIIYFYCCKFLVAEKFLEGVEVNQNYPLLLLHLVHKPQVDMTIRVIGAVTFKNYIKRNWSVVGLPTDLYY